jgi:hypothetical protein
VQADLVPVNRGIIQPPYLRYLRLRDLIAGRKKYYASGGKSAAPRR